MLPRGSVPHHFGAHHEGSVDLERRSLRPTHQRTELEELLEPFHHLSISSSEILIPVTDPREISEPHLSDSDLGLDEFLQNSESVSLYPDFPGGFDLDKSFAPPIERQELSPPTDPSSSSSLSSGDSELAAEQLLTPSQSLTIIPTIIPPAQVPIQNTPLMSLINSAYIRIMSGARDMPLRGSNKALKFSGHTEDITRYLEDIKQLCVEAGRDTGKDKIHWAIHYTDHNEAGFWSTLDAASNGLDDWDAFSGELLNYYPGTSVKDHRYTKANLETLLYHQVQKPMGSLEDLGKYVCEFRRILGLIQKKKKLPDNYINKKFLEGFPLRFWNSLLTHLQLSDLDHDINEPWVFDLVYKHANYLLSRAKRNLPQPDSSALFPQNSAPPSSSTVPTILKCKYVQVAQQPTSMSSPQQSQEGQFRHSFDPWCFFCRSTDSHHTAECTLCHEYVQAGKCSLIGGRVFMPDGTDIPRMAAGQNFKEKIDNFLAMRDSIITSANLVSVQCPNQSSNSSRGHDTPPHLVSTMFFSNEEASEFQVNLHPSSYLIDEELENNADEEDQRALARAYVQVEELKNSIKKKKVARFDSIEILAHCQ